MIWLILFCGIAALPAQSRSPSDEVFLTERFLARTHSALIGFPPGTALNVISKSEDTFRVTAAGSTVPFDVPKAKLTTDANLAVRLAQNEYAAQEAAAQESARQMEASRQSQAAAQQQLAPQDVGYFVGEGGGPLMPATPENLSRFGPPVYGTGANAARVIQAQVDSELAAARQRELKLQRAQAAKRIAANNGQNGNQTAPMQQAETQRLRATEQQRTEDQRIRESQRQQTQLQQESERFRRESERQWQGTLQRQQAFIQQSRVDSARSQLQLDQIMHSHAQLQMDRDNYRYEQEQQKRQQQQIQQQREQQRWEDATRKQSPG